MLDNLVHSNAYWAFTDTWDEEYKQEFEKKKEVFFKVTGMIKCNTLLDYMNLYLHCDVLLLADIIQTARAVFFKTHNLDLVRYYGAPGYSWDAFLYYLHKNGSIYRPELFISTEMNMVCFFMKCIRGGCSGIMNDLHKRTHR